MNPFPPPFPLTLSDSSPLLKNHHYTVVSVNISLKNINTIGYINTFTLEEGEVLNTKIILSEITFRITVVEGDETKLKIPEHTSVDYSVTASQEHVNLLRLYQHSRLLN